MLPANHESFVADLRAISSQYGLGNIWNMNESEFFFVSVQIVPTCLLLNRVRKYVEPNLGNTRIE